MYILTYMHALNSESEVCYSVAVFTLKQYYLTIQRKPLNRAIVAHISRPYTPTFAVTDKMTQQSEITRLLDESSSRMQSSVTTLENQDTGLTGISVIRNARGMKALEKSLRDRDVYDSYVSLNIEHARLDRYTSTRRSRSRYVSFISLCNRTIFKSGIV